MRWLLYAAAWAVLMFAVLWLIRGEHMTLAKTASLAAALGCLITASRYLLGKIFPKR